MGRAYWYSGSHWNDGDSEVWPGTVFYARVEDPLAWQRSGWYQYIIAGWEPAVQKYEAWEATGLHTRLFTHSDVLRGVTRFKKCSHDQLEREARMVAWWEPNELLGPVDVGHFRPWAWKRARPDRRDAVFPTRVTGFKPHGTLEMAGPMLFHLHSRSRRDERFKRVVDVGAGTGRMAAWLTTWGLEAIALDVVKPQTPEFEVTEFDGRTLPLEDKSVDCVIFSFVLHHCRHFEVQRALLMEAARVSRQWIAIIEDTPQEAIHWKNTKGHDRLGTFNSWPEWMGLFKKLRLDHLVHSGDVWAGSKSRPSPYFCKRAYFILEVQADALIRGPTLRGASGGALPARGYAAEAPRQCRGCIEAADDPEGVVILRDIKADWMDEANVPWTYEQLKLPETIAQGLKSQGFHTPSPIQREAVPLALEGHDLVGVAATGSGKTLAYLLPMLLRLLSTPSHHGPFGLVLLPTRELAMQVATCGNALLGKDEDCGSGLGDLERCISVVSIWGGGSRPEQQKHLRYGSHRDAPGSGSWIVCAAPGRLLDLICAEEEEGREPLASVRVLVLDEGDRMLEEGLGDQLDGIALRTAHLRQTLFFSATWREEKVGEQARRFCRHTPVVIQIGENGTMQEGSVSACPRNIRQIVEVFDDVESEEKREERKLSRLLELLRGALEQGSTREETGDAQCVPFGKALVFCTARKLADTVVAQLADRGCEALALHGGKVQQERNYNLERFASSEEQTPNVLVATDVLGRGIDLPNVTHVFVFDMPGCIDDYIHRIGRTARGMDGQGQAICFFEYADCLPNLAEELVTHLEVTEQAVPPELKRIAQEVAEGGRRRVKKEELELPAYGLATADELGVWHASGYRSWMFESLSLKASGWFIFCHAGVLETDRGPGQWRRMEGSDEIMEVVFGNFELQLQFFPKWQGKKRPNFSSIASAASKHGQVTGWIQKSKQYRWVDPWVDMEGAEELPETGAKEPQSEAA